MNPIRKHRLSGALAITLLLGGNAYAFQSERLEVTALGEGPAVIFLPGLGASPEIWRETVSQLDGHEVHLVHVNGFAGSEASANATGDLLTPLTEEIARYIEERGLEEVSVVGHSFGGMVAALIAARHPDMVGRLMIVDIPAYLGDIMGLSTEEINVMAEHLRSQALSMSPQERQAADLAFVSAGIRVESRRRSVLADMSRSDPAVVAQAQYETLVADLRPELATIEAATTVVFVTPAQAPDMSPNAIEAFYAGQYAPVSDLELEFVAESGHYVMLDQPVHFTGLVKAFLD